MNISTLLFKALYWYISTVDKKNEIIFMNYGYHDDDWYLPLHTDDENNRFSIQLYHRLTHKVEIKDKNILEIGCGRGGGLAFLTKTLLPGKALGIDLNTKAVAFGNKFYQINGLTFEQGNATCLGLPDQSADVILNVESSHRYDSMELFLKEVFRILRPGGYFLYTDFRRKEEMNDLNVLLQEYDYECVDHQIINLNVLLALQKDANRRMALVEKFSPFFLKKYLHNFAGSLDSPTFNDIRSGDLVYYIYCFRKK